MSRRGEIRERWRRILQEQRASGLSVTAFCRRAGVAYSGYYKWRRKLAGEAVFAGVKIVASSGEETAERGGRFADPGDLELRLPDCRSVVVPRGFDRQTLRDLLDVLEGGAAEIGRRGADR